jgi:hypothetical protein
MIEFVKRIVAALNNVLLFILGNPTNNPIWKKATPIQKAAIILVAMVICVVVIIFPVLRW